MLIDAATHIRGDARVERTRVGADQVDGPVVRFTLFDDGDWIIHVDAGPHHRRGLITNMRNNAEGREFVILVEPQPQGVAQ